jgi:hypothetical protein
VVVAVAVVGQIHLVEMAELIRVVVVAVEHTTTPTIKVAMVAAE